MDIQCGITRAVTVGHGGPAAFPAGGHPPPGWFCQLLRKERFHACGRLCGAVRCSDLFPNHPADTSRGTSTGAPTRSPWPHMSPRWSSTPGASRPTSTARQHNRHRQPQHCRSKTMTRSRNLKDRAQIAIVGLKPLPHDGMAINRKRCPGDQLEGELIWGEW